MFMWKVISISGVTTGGGGHVPPNWTAKKENKRLKVVRR